MTDESRRTIGWDELPPDVQAMAREAKKDGMTREDRVLSCIIHFLEHDLAGTVMKALLDREVDPEVPIVNLGMIMVRLTCFVQETEPELWETYKRGVLRESRAYPGRQLDQEERVSQAFVDYIKSALRIMDEAPIGDA